MAIKHLHVLDHSEFEIHKELYTYTDISGISICFI
jgi:hypothetical protein